MKTIELDASGWKTILDFYHALLAAVGAPEWHSFSPDALVDSMIWGGINTLEAPYTIRISGLSSAPADVRACIGRAKQALVWGREDFKERTGHDIDVSIETLP